MSPRHFCLAAFLISLSAWCGACKCTGLEVTTDPRLDIDVSSKGFQARTVELRKLDEQLGDVPRPNYLIDIHTHTFNANYLPLPEIVQARVPSAELRYIGRGLVRALQLSTDPPYRPDGPEALVAAPPSSVAARLRKIMGEVAPGGESILADGPSLQEARAFIRGADDPDDRNQLMTWEELKRDERFLDGVDYLLAANPESGPADLAALKAKVLASKWLVKLLKTVPFLGALGTRDVDMPWLYRSKFGLTDTSVPPRKVLMATLQGDFGPTYGGVGEGRDAPAELQRRYRDYRTVLLPAASALQARPDQDLLFFASYDPFMARRSGLELAYDAVMEYGAVGLKYYPPSGSRATDNEIPPLPKARHKQPSWRSRYEEGGLPLQGTDLDQRIAEFLDWCVDSKIPVFTHSNPKEFEADTCYGYWFPHPEYWKRFLDSDEKRNSLRLCLGHASGPDFWFGTRNRKRPTSGWGPVAAFLAMNYENVYIEMGVQKQIVDKEQRLHFLTVLETLEEIGRREGFPYSISKKILYGSDWFMPIGDPMAYLDGYARAMATLDARDSGARWTENFFWRNALEYLDVERRKKEGLDVVRISAERPGGNVALPNSVAADLAEFPGGR